MDNSTLHRTVIALQTAVPRRIVVGMSGGVDSAVSAYLLKEAGHEVIGLFMKNWEEDDGSNHCTSAADARDAKAVCDKLGIPLHTVNFAREYWERVFEVCLQAYEAGITPNPDVLCNREIKFKSFLSYATDTFGVDCIATGHYVRNNFLPTGDCQLLKGVDPDKDQSYFLYLLKSEQIAKSLFPIGDLKKTEVRKIAESLQLPNARKKDSTGICFIGERQFKSFLSRYLPLSPGNIVTETGEVLGEHDGLFFYTIGQRQGLSIGGKKYHSEAPWYVAQKDLVNNRLVVVQGSEHPLLYRSALTCDQLSWVADAPHFPARLQAKIRYRQTDVFCQVSQTKDGKLHVAFEVPQRAITPGQSIVFYLNDVCLGGGLITE